MEKRALVVAAFVVLTTPACSRPCSTHSRFPLTRDSLERSLELGTQYLLSNQKAAGNFNYAYDWRKRKMSQDDNAVRQTGAMWGLALIYHAEKSPKVGAALDRAIEFFERSSRVGGGGTRFVAYPGAQVGQTGATALAALTLIDYLRAEPDHLTLERRKVLRGQLDEYLAELLLLRRPDGLWHANYNVKDGRPLGGTSPYVDGEALLAFVKAARYLDRDDLRDRTMESAEKGYQEHIVAARKKDKDSNKTKGYYQWSSMAFFELATSGWPDTAQYADRVIELADWMIDVHRTLSRTRNTAYAYEGIIHAWRLAELAGDKAHLRKFGRVIEKGMAKLTSWQVGHPTANRCITRRKTNDPLAVGGVQNHHQESLLRIDVTQHQMHAVILALRYYYAEGD